MKLSTSTDYQHHPCSKNMMSWNLWSWRGHYIVFTMVWNLWSWRILHRVFFYGMESVVLSMTLHSVYKCVESMVLTNILHSVYCGVECMVLTNDEAKRKSATHCRKSCWETLENVRTLAFTPKLVSPWVLIAALKVKVDNAAAGGHPVKDFF